jgi:ADP-dependent NAD(P)H-hydrate dehydratase / NAD(P)H-hydrate epimerase
VLAARGALQARPGLVSVFTSESSYIPVASQLQSAMVHPWKTGRRLPDSITAVVFGPGLADPNLPADWRSEMSYLWQELPIPMIADASGLDWLPNGPANQNGIRIITPHPGEAARLLKTTSAAVQEARPKMLSKLSRRYGDCWVVLKGHQTLIGRSTGAIFINPSGNSFLAQGGSGDVLAGFLGGLLAQPALQSDPLLALRYGVWQHGATADALSAKHRNWVVEDLVQALGSSAS